MNISSTLVKNRVPGLALVFILVVLSFGITSHYAADDALVDDESETDFAKHGLDDFNPQEKGPVPPGTKSNNGQTKIFPAVWCVDIDDETTRSMCWKAYQNGLNYYQFGLKHRQRVLEWQHLSTKIILFVVLTLVGMGLYFAWVQFQKGETLEAQNKIELSAEGVKVSSPVLGVIILALSLGFFYLYLVHVYPIQEII
ncbi:MAG: hypothetical protein GY806_07575 [Gammaproteobacteria bacterium]|nr:hypothetical protein [Gammaproteobacteria bacterium]